MKPDSRSLTLCWWLAALGLHALALNNVAPFFQHVRDGDDRRANLGSHSDLQVQLLAAPPLHALSQQFVQSSLAAAIATPTATTQRANQPAAESSQHSYSLHGLSKKPILLGGSPSMVDLPLNDTVVGTLILRLGIDRFGKLKEIKTVRSTLPLEVQTQLLEQLDSAAFQPGEVEGMAVDAEMLLVLEINGV